MKFRTFKQRYNCRQRLAVVQLNYMLERGALTERQRKAFNRADTLMSEAWDACRDQPRMNRYCATRELWRCGTVLR